MWKTALLILGFSAAPAAAAPPPDVEKVVAPDENASLPAEAKPFGVKASDLAKQVKKAGDLVRVGGEMLITTRVEAEHAIGTAEEADKAKAKKAAAAAFTALRKKLVALAKDITTQRKQIATKRKKKDAGPHWEALDDRLRTSAHELKDIGIQYRSALDKPDPTLEKTLAAAAK